MKFVKFFLVFELFCVTAFDYPNCKKSFGFSKICDYYKFDQSCVPWNLTNCRKFRTKTFDPKCPRYVCVSTLIKLKLKDYNYYLKKVISPTFNRVNKKANFVN